jgi:hypothetical protein|tara:strand:- start:138 stop:356 length:219 start_codon:yes stop_codon:yes gene_type:complete
MKLQATMNKTTFSIETEGDDLNVAEMLNHFKGLLVAMGYHPQSVDGHFTEGEDTWFNEPQGESESWQNALCK